MKKKNKPKKNKNYFRNRHLRKKSLVILEDTQKDYFEDLGTDGAKAARLFLGGWNDILNRLYHRRLTKEVTAFERRRGRPETICLIGLTALCELTEGLAIDLPIDKSWSRSPTAEANLVPIALIEQLRELLLGALHLLSLGLDNPSRVLLRSAYETAWLLIVTLGDKEKFQHYQALDEEFEDFEREKRIWRAHFTPGKLLRSVRDLETKFQFTLYDSAIVGFNERQELYSYYSLSTHSSYPLTVSMLRVGHTDMKRASSVSIKRSLIHIEHLINEALFASISLLRRVHGFCPKKETKRWKFFIENTAFFWGLSVAGRGRSINSKIIKEFFYSDPRASQEKMANESDGTKLV